MKKEINFTAIIEKSDDGWYVGQIEEIPEIISQGKTIHELMDNLRDALDLILDNRKKNIMKDYEGKKYITRNLSIKG